MPRFSLTRSKASSGEEHWLTRYVASIAPVLPMPAPQQTITGLFWASISSTKFTNSRMSPMLGAEKSLIGMKVYSNPMFLTCSSSRGRSIFRHTIARSPSFHNQVSCRSLSGLALPASLPLINHENLAGLAEPRTITRRNSPLLPSLLLPEVICSN